MTENTWTNLRGIPRDQLDYESWTRDTDGKVSRRVKVSDSGPSSGYVISWKHSKISVNNATATKVPTVDLTDRKTIEIFNTSAETIYAGPTSGVTTSTGRPILQGETWNVDLGEPLSIYIITTATTFDLEVTEFA